MPDFAGFWADRKRRIGVLAAGGAVVLLVAVIAGCSGDERPTLRRERETTTTSSATTTTLPPGVSLVAQVTGPQVGVYDSPEAPAPARTFNNPWLLNEEADKAIPQVFLVEEQRGDGWIRVLLPERPNGSSGWVRASEVNVTQNPYRFRVTLGEHKITVSERDKTIYEGPIAIGKESTPTPTGKYYTRVLLQAPDPNTVYGPFAYGLSAHSDVLTEFNGGDGEVGVHGNNDKSVLGKSVTAGCIRMDNDEITRLSKLLPLGTPVEIVN